MAITRKTKLMDKLHRGAVNTILIFTGFCTIFLGYSIYNFITVVKPQYIERRTAIEEEFLAEGKADEDSNEDVK